MKKRIITLFLAALIFISMVKLPSNASSMAMKNWQQTEPNSTWNSVPFDGDTFGNTGCGIMSLVNAVHYLNGNWMDPIIVANWAHDVKRAYSGYSGTDRWKFYPYVTDKFGSEYQFNIIKCYSSEKSGVLIGNTEFKNHIKNGGTAVVHVIGHFMAIVDYDSATDKYLLWDNCAGDGKGGHRIGLTHIAGDWLTAEQLSGNLPRENAYYLNVDWYCLISSTKPTSSVYKEYTCRDSVLKSKKEIYTSGSIADKITVDAGDAVGMKITVNGWHASTVMTKQYGYSVDGGEIKYDAKFNQPAEQAVQDMAVSKIGDAAFSSRFSVQLPVPNNKAHTYKIYAKDGNNETLIWTITKSAYPGAATAKPTATPTAKPVVTTAPTPKATAKATAAPTAKPTAIVTAEVTAPVTAISTIEATENATPIATIDVNASELPAEETALPVDETEIPADETELPAEATETPADETEVPVETTQAPAEATPEADKKDNNKKGCKNVIGSSALVAVSICGIAFILRKKEN